MNKGDPNAYPYTFLDVDAMSGFGPETVTVHKPVTGMYKIYVDCFSCWGVESYQKFYKSDATIRVFDQWGMQAEYRIADAKLDSKKKPAKYWDVAYRRCWPPPPIASKKTAKGFADRDNKWTFHTYNAFSQVRPQ